MSGSGQRRYGEKETREILERAGEMQSVGVSKDGVTLDELKQVAGTMGFDPDLVARAAEEYDSSGPSSRILGTTGRVDLEQTLQGTLTEDRWVEMVIQLRKTFGGPGETNRLGAAYEWSYKTDNGTVHFSAAPSRKGVALHLTQDYSQGMTIAWTLGGIMSFFVSLITGIALVKKADAPVVFAMLAFIAIIFTVAMIIRYALAAWGQNEARKCRDAMGRLALAVSDTSPLSNLGPAQTVDDSTVQITG